MIVASLFRFRPTDRPQFDCAVETSSSSKRTAVRTEPFERLNDHSVARSRRKKEFSYTRFICHLARGTCLPRSFKPSNPRPCEPRAVLSSLSGKHLNESDFYRFAIARVGKLREDLRAATRAARPPLRARPRAARSLLRRGGSRSPHRAASTGPCRSRPRSGTPRPPLP